MPSVRKGSIIRLICGQISAGMLIVGIPTVVILGLFGHLTWPHVWLVVLALLHAGLVAAQVAISGDWVPRSWLAGAYLTLPLLNSLAGWSAYRHGAYLIMACSGAFLVLSLQMAVQIVQSGSSGEPGGRRPPKGGTSGGPFVADDDMAMMDF